MKSLFKVKDLWRLKLPLDTTRVTSSPRTIVVIVAMMSTFLAITVVKNSYPSTVYFHTGVDTIYQRTTYFLLPNMTTEPGVEQAREKLGCLEKHSKRMEWPLPVVSLKDMKTPRFLPDYKNPCWKSNNKGEKSRLLCVPYFYLAGFPKCGTTDLFFRLIQHPLIASGRKKEGNYLTKIIYQNTFSCNDHKNIEEKTKCVLTNYADEIFERTIDSLKRNDKSRSTAKAEYKPKLEQKFKIQWRKLRSEAESVIKHPMITVDGSASTVWKNLEWRKIAENQGCPGPVVGAPHFLAKMNPNVKVIIMLRDPTERLYSDYMFFGKIRNLTSLEDFHIKVQASIEDFKTCTSTEKTPFSICVQRHTAPGKVRLTLGIYHIYLSQWMSLLPRSQLLVIHSETYRNDIPGTLARVFRFLELPKLSNAALKAIASLEKYRTGYKKRKSGPMFSSTEATLRKFYAEHNERLAKILGDDRFAWRI